MLQIRTCQRGEKEEEKEERVTLDVEGVRKALRQARICE